MERERAEPPRRPAGRIGNGGGHHQPNGEQRQHGSATAVAFPTGRTGDQDEHQRPEQVPLLLHGQAPQVAKQGGSAGEVGHMAEDLAPVGHVEDAPRVVAAQLRVLFGRPPQCRPHTHRQQHREQRGQQPAPTASPELTETDPTATIALLDEQAGDEIPGDDEEHLDPEEPPVHPPEPGVVEDDADHGQRANAVQAGLVAHRFANWAAGLEDEQALE